MKQLKQPLPPGFNPRDHLQVLSLPEGTRSLNFLARFIFSKGESVYDPLWRYVKKVNSQIYKGQGAQVRIGDYSIGMRGPNRIFSHADFKKNLLYIGRKLVIPFNSIQGIVAAHGMLPWRKIPIFVLMVKVSGCKSFIPVHQCILDLTVVELADFLSSHMHVPLGVASTPLKILIRPSSPVIEHAKGETKLCDIRGLLTTRTPSGSTMVKLLTHQRPLTILESPDPLGWIENWGIITDDLISMVTRRTGSHYANN